MKRILFLFPIFLLLAGCEGRGDSHVSLPSAEPVGDRLTCVVAAPDSTTLLLGSMHPRFIAYDPADGFTTSFPLPDYTERQRTYDIMPVGPATFLVAKRNCGLIAVTYADSAARPVIANVCRVYAPDGELPRKNTRYSAYGLVAAGDSMILAGTSNSLMYLTRDAIGRLATDTAVTASYFVPLLHLRDHRVQFAQEAVFLQNDSLLTATDNGIYRVSLADAARKETHMDILYEKARCWMASLEGDSLAVLWSDPEKPERGRLLTRFALGREGSRGSTRAVSPSVSWIGLMGDSLVSLGAQGDFDCFHSAANIGSRFYFIDRGRLRYSERGLGNESGERVKLVSGAYALSGDMGLWRIDGGKPVYLGDITGVSGIRNIYADGKTLYLTMANGVYRVDLSSRLLPVNRRAHLVKSNRDWLRDRVESVWASGDTLLLGTRCALYSVNLATGKTEDYYLPKLRDAFESPYVQRIERQADGTFLLETLNDGIWTLPSLAPGTNASRSSVARIENDPRIGMPLPARPALTWHSMADSAFWLLIAALAAIGALTLVFIAVRRRYRNRVTNLLKSLSNKTSHVSELESQLKESHNENRELQKAYEDRRREWEESSRRVRDALREPMSSAVSALKTAVITSSPESAFSRRAARCIAAIEAYLNESAESAGLLEKAVDAYFDMRNFMAESIVAVKILCSNIPENEIMKRPMCNLADKVNVSVPGNSFAGQSAWLASIDPSLQECISNIDNRLTAIIRTRGAAAPQFTENDLNYMWNHVVLPTATAWGSEKILRAKINPKDKNPDEGVLHRTWHMLTISFWGCEKPIVNQKSIINRDDIRSQLRLDKPEKDKDPGTVYIFWARQLSAGIMAYDGDAWPATPGDILWKVWFSKSGLSTGIRYAFYRQHGLETPSDVAAAITSRPVGRPPSANK